MKRSQHGFTLLELAFSISIIGILVLLALQFIPSSIVKAKDARTKNNLNRLRTAVEDYYSDNDAYPPFELMNNCGGDQLSPYLSKLYCNEGNTPYTYVRSENGQCYAFFTKLQAPSDPDVKKVGCSEGCGPFNEYNYGISNDKLQ